MAPDKPAMMSPMYSTLGVSSSALADLRAGPAWNASRGAAYHARVVAHAQAPPPAAPAPAPAPVMRSVAAPSTSAPQAAPMASVTPAVASSSAAAPPAFAPSYLHARPAGQHAQAGVMSSTSVLESSKLIRTGGGPPLQHLEFAALADSSVGGNGLPRPYGRFGAARNGDGTAVYERLPPSRAKEWYERMYPGQLGGPSTSSPNSRGSTAPPLTGGERVMRKSAHSTPATPVHHSRRPRDTPMASMMSLIRSRGGSPTRMSLRVSVDSMRAGYKRPEGSLSMPASPSSTGRSLGERFVLPAATFLTEMPHMPLNVRVDCGYNSGRELLLSGLHRSSALHGPGDQQQQHQLASLVAQGLVSPLRMPSPTRAGTADSHAVPGYRCVSRGVYVPVDERQEAAMNLSVEGPILAYASKGIAVPPAHAILSAIDDSMHSRPTEAKALEFHVDHRAAITSPGPPPPPMPPAPFRIGHLPPEAALPRRFVPAVGR